MKARTLCNRHQFAQPQLKSREGSLRERNFTTMKLRKWRNEWRGTGRLVLSWPLILPCSLTNTSVTTGNKRTKRRFSLAVTLQMFAGLGEQHCKSIWSGTPINSCKNLPKKMMKSAPWCSPYRYVTSRSMPPFHMLSRPASENLASWESSSVGIKRLPVWDLLNPG